MANNSVTDDLYPRPDLVLLRYEGAQEWLPCYVVDVWRPEDLAELQGQLEDGETALKTAHIILGAFRGLTKSGLRVDSVTRLVLGRVPFAVFRCNGVLVDCTGRRLEVQRG